MKYNIRIETDYTVEVQAENSIEAIQKAAQLFPQQEMAVTVEEVKP